MPVAFPFARLEQRIPMEVGIVLDGNSEIPGMEKTFTENVSARGARVVTIRRWVLNDRLTVRTACQPVHGSGYAIGVEFIEPRGRWIVDSKK